MRTGVSQLELHFYEFWQAGGAAALTFKAFKPATAPPPVDASTRLTSSTSSSEMESPSERSEAVARIASMGVRRLRAGGVRMARSMAEGSRYVMEVRRVEVD